MQVIEAGRLIDGSGEPPRENVRLFVEKGRIVDVLSQGESAVPDGAEVIDASGRTVMPGLIDAHVHVMWAGRPEEQDVNWKESLVGDLPGTITLRAYINARCDLEAGFTALRDMTCHDFADISLRDAINRGLVEGPRLVTCGYGLTSTGGHMDDHKGLRTDVAIRVGGFDNVVDTPDQARIAVRTLVKMGVDHIKINAGRGYRVHGRPLIFAPEMRLDVITAIVEEAHAAGRRVAAHSLGSDGEKWAVLAGVDSLEHAHFISDEILRLMAERGTYLVPTMTHCVRNTRLLRETLPPEQQPDNLILNAYDSMYRVIPKALDLGIRIATGTDAGADNVPHGCNAMELELLTTIGMTPMQALVAGTRTSAEVLDLADQVGQLRKGYLADLLVVDGDPLADLCLLQEPKNIKVVMKNGRVEVRRG